MAESRSLKAARSGTRGYRPAMYVTTKHWLDDLLPRLETQWVEQNAPIANHLQRGLTDEQVAAI
jgi:hypothetical protein